MVFTLVLFFTSAAQNVENNDANPEIIVIDTVLLKLQENQMKINRAEADYHKSYIHVLESIDSLKKSKE